MKYYKNYSGTRNQCWEWVGEAGTKREKWGLCGDVDDSGRHGNCVAIDGRIYIR